MEFLDLKSNLRTLIDDSKYKGIKAKKEAFESTMKDIVKKIIGDGYSSKEMNDKVNNMTMNDVWLQLFQVEFKNKDLKDIKLNRLASDIKDKKFKVFYEDFKLTSKRFIKNSTTENNCRFNTAKSR